MNSSSGIFQLIVSVIGSSVVVTIINVIVARRKTNAETESIVTSTAQSLLKDVNAEMKELRDRLDIVEAQLEEARKRARVAEDEAQQAKHAERELRAYVGVLQRNVNAYRLRVEQLTKLLQQAGIGVPEWTPPRGLEEFRETAFQPPIGPG